MPLHRASAPLLLAAAFTAATPCTLGAQSSTHVDPAPSAIVDTAIERMGGLDALRAIKTARYSMVTQWLSTTFSKRPFTDAPSYEMNTDMRDYPSRTWRNTRRFPNGDAWTVVSDLVVDTIAARYSDTPLPSVANAGRTIDHWTALNVAYIDERRELFAFTPDRLLLNLHDARDLRARRDTTIGGVAHTSVSATIDGFPTTAFFRRGDGFLTLARYHADESNDFGLAPWGPMSVEEWYTGWQYDSAAHVRAPSQWDIVRVGKPYKRMTILSVSYNPALPADSLVLGDSIRAEYLAHARRPMADLPLTNAHLVSNGAIAIFASPGGPLAAVKVGGGWLLLEPGNLPLNAERAAAWLAANDSGRKVVGGILGTAFPSGGASWVAAHRLPLYVSPPGAAGDSASLADYGAPRGAIRVITRGQWLEPAGSTRDSIWIESIAVPNLQRALLVYVPSLRWAYSSAISEPSQFAAVAERLRARGWKVDVVGSPRSPAGVAP
ncbi:MAG TPA: hypothetical protein VJO52_07645 [Gemmatimonadaceae bacterium]|nr:hypothetical protein [Gemmatimonadaceae bacterium]